MKYGIKVQIWKKSWPNLRKFWGKYGQKRRKCWRKIEQKVFQSQKWSILGQSAKMFRYLHAFYQKGQIELFRKKKLE